MVNPLQELIRGRMAEQGWSFADVARRGKLPRSTVHHLATNERPSRPPHPQTVTKLAAGLDLPPEQVRAVAAQSAAHTAPPRTRSGMANGDPEVEIMAAAFGRLGRADRRHVAELVRSLLDRRDAEADRLFDALNEAARHRIDDESVTVTRMPEREQQAAEV